MLSIDGKAPTAPDYPSAVVVGLIHKPQTVTTDAKAFIQYASSDKAKQVVNRPGRRARDANSRMLFRSLSAKLISVMLTATSVALFALVGGTLIRVERGLSEQSQELARLSVAKLAEDAARRGQPVQGAARHAAAGRRRGGWAWWRSGSTSSAPSSRATSSP